MNKNLIDELINIGWSPEGALFIFDKVQENPTNPVFAHLLKGLDIQVTPRCSNCGYQGSALDKHHIDGRKVSNKTIWLCANCHRELHHG